MNLNGKLLKTNTTLQEAQDFQSKVFLFFVTLNWQLYQESRKENNNNNQTGVLKWFQLFHYHFWQHDHLSFHSLHLNSAVCFLSYFISTSHCRRGVCVCVYACPPDLNQIGLLYNLQLWSPLSQQLQRETISTLSSLIKENSFNSTTSLLLWLFFILAVAQDNINLL